MAGAVVLLQPRSVVTSNLTKRVLAVCGSSGHWKPDESQAYEEALRAVGIEPILISPDSPGWAGEASGLVLMGGSDVNPLRYAESPHPETQAPDDARDDLERLLIEEAISHDMPLLAICRGIQILNVQHGGTLVQHLDSTPRHRQRTADKSQPAHQIEISPGTLLAEIAGSCLTWNVNSRHHQAIARLGDGLRVSARDIRDGTIEAVERPDKRFVIGVQWHPENQIATDETQAKLFQAFAAAL
jgi:putative glutamine amidotransferase